MTRTHKRTVYSRTDRNGFAYVTVLLLIAALVSLSLSFLSRAGIGTSATLDRGDAIRAEYLAEAAANHGMWRLINEPAFPAAVDKYYMHDLAGGRYGYMARRHTGTTFATIAAVGAVGETVARSSYVLNIQGGGGGASQMVTGTYVGNEADDRAITGVAFRPDVVIVKGDVKKDAVIRTSSMTGDLSKMMKGGDKMEADLIQSLDPFGFTVGTHDAVNKNGVAYYWAAFRAVEGQMELGTYIGDDSGDIDITGLCITPALVLVMSEDKKEAVFRVDPWPDTFDFNNGGAEKDCIASPFLTDGFRVGQDDRVNKTGDKYHYIAWAGIAGQQVAGTYIGDEVDDRDILGLGLQPEYVWVRCADSDHMFHRPASLGGGDQSMFFADKKHEPDRIQALLSDGFQIGTDDDVNRDGRFYIYFAWAQK
jgi:hypothetical protein